MLGKKSCNPRDGTPQVLRVNGNPSKDAGAKPNEGMIMSYRFPIYIAALAMAAVSLSSMAVEAKGGPRGERPDFSEIDANGDGALTQEEIQAFMSTRGQARFAETDANGDGSLSRDEMIAAADARREGRIDSMIERLDTDGDGALSQEELAEGRDRFQGRRGGRIEARFERMDANDDGTISQEEWTARAHRR
jgi:hypothetical protein